MDKLPFEMLDILYKSGFREPMASTYLCGVINTLMLHVKEEDKLVKRFNLKIREGENFVGLDKIIDQLSDAKASMLDITELTGLRHAPIIAALVKHKTKLKEDILCA